MSRRRTSLKLLNLAAASLCLLLGLGCDSAAQKPSEESPKGAHTTGGESNGVPVPGSQNATPTLGSSSITLPARLTDANVFFATSNQLAVYDSEELEKVACLLNFGDQLLIRDHFQDSLKVRIDAFAQQRHSCPKELTYGYIKLSDLVAPPPSPGGEEMLIPEELVPLFSDSGAGDEQLCLLHKGAKVQIKERRALTHTQVAVSSESCDNGYEGLGVIRDPAYLSFEERYARYPHYRAFTLAVDLPVFAGKAMQEPPLCVLAKGNYVLEVEKELSLQMPPSQTCPSDTVTAYFSYSSGIWLEEHPR